MCVCDYPSFKVTKLVFSWDLRIKYELCDGHKFVTYQCVQKSLVDGQSSVLIVF